MLANGDLALSNEGTCNTSLLFTQRDSPPICLSFRQTEPEGNDQDGWACAKPV